MAQGPSQRPTQSSSRRQVAEPTGHFTQEHYTPGSQGSESEKKFRVQGEETGVQQDSRVPKTLLDTGRSSGGLVTVSGMRPAEGPAVAVSTQALPTFLW